MGLQLKAQKCVVIRLVAGRDPRKAILELHPAARDIRLAESGAY